MSGDAAGRRRWPRRDLRDANVLARTELRCRLRSIRQDTRRLFATAAMGLLFVGIFPLMLYGIATGYGQQFASGPVPLGETGVALLGAIGAGLYVGGASGFGQESVGAVGPLVRTTITPRAVTLGRLWTELGIAMAIVVLVGVGLLLEVAVGAGSPVPSTILGLAALPVGAAAVAVGRVLGTSLRYVNRALRLSLWSKAILYLAVTVVGYVGVYRLFLSGVEDGNGPGSFLPSAFLPGEPLQAYASVVFAPLGSSPRPLGAFVAVSILALVALGFALSVRLETRLLLADPVPDDAERVTGTRGVPGPFAYSASGRVAWRYLLRTRRDPRMLGHLLGLLFGVLGLVGSALSDPHMLRTTGPAMVVVGGAIVAGAAYCMNPLGDDRGQLPLLLTSTRSVGVLLRGRALAGLTLGLAVAVGLGVPISLLVHPPGAVAAQSLFAVFLATAGAGTALGIGAVVPRFDEREYMSVERAHPSTVALIGFMLGGTVVGAIGLILLWWALSEGLGVGTALPWAVYLLVVGAIGAGGYVYAVQTLDGLVLDEL